MLRRNLHFSTFEIVTGNKVGHTGNRVRTIQCGSTVQYQLDPFQHDGRRQVVDVHLGTGVAVDGHTLTIHQDQGRAFTQATQVDGVTGCIPVTYGVGCGNLWHVTHCLGNGYTLVGLQFLVVHNSNRLRPVCRTGDEGASYLDFFNIAILCHQGKGTGRCSGKRYCSRELFIAQVD